MKKFLMPVAAFVAALALLVGVTGSASAYSTYDESGKRADLLSQHNAVRKSKCGANSLNMTDGLNSAALYHAGDMADENYFTHDSQNPYELWWKRIERFTTHDAGGENIAKNQLSVTEVMGDWMASPEHKVNIMNCAFKYVGFGYAYVYPSNGGAPRRFWVADFAY